MHKKLYDLDSVIAEYCSITFLKRRKWHHPWDRWSALILRKKAYRIAEAYRTGLLCTSHFKGTQEWEFFGSETLHNCLPSLLLDDGDKMNWNSVWCGKKYFVPGRLVQPRLDENLLYRHEEPSAKQPRKVPFHLFCLSPHSPQFQQSAGATLL